MFAQEMALHPLRQFRIDLGDLVQTLVQDLDRAHVLAGGKQDDRQRDPSPRPGPHITRELDRATQIGTCAGVARLHLGMPISSHSGAGSSSGSSSAIDLLR